MDVDFARQGDGITVRVPVPGSPQTTRAEYQFAADGSLLHDELPLEANYLVQVTQDRIELVHLPYGPLAPRARQTLQDWRVQPLGGARLRIEPVRTQHGLSMHTVLDLQEKKRLEEVIPYFDKRGTPLGSWWIDFSRPEAELRDASGAVLRTARLEAEQNGQVWLLREQDGSVLLSSVRVGRNRLTLPFRPLTPAQPAPAAQAEQAVTTDVAPRHVVEAIEPLGEPGIFGTLSGDAEASGATVVRAMPMLQPEPLVRTYLEQPHGQIGRAELVEEDVPGPEDAMDAPWAFQQLLKLARSVPDDRITPVAQAGGEVDEVKLDLTGLSFLDDLPQSPEWDWRTGAWVGMLDPRRVEEAVPSVRAGLLASGRDPRELHGVLRELLAQALESVITRARFALHMHLHGSPPRTWTPKWLPKNLRDFQIIPLHKGDYAVVHQPSDTRMEFHGGDDVVREVPLRDVPLELEGLKIRLRGTGTKLRPEELVGPSSRCEGLSVTRIGRKWEVQNGFKIINRITRNEFRFGPEGTLFNADLQLGERLRTVRVYFAEPGRRPELLNGAKGAAARRLSTEFLGDGRFAVMETDLSGRLVQRTVFTSSGEPKEVTLTVTESDPSGRLVQRTLFTSGGEPTRVTPAEGNGPITVSRDGRQAGEREIRPARQAGLPAVRRDLMQRYPQRAEMHIVDPEDEATGTVERVEEFQLADLGPLQVVMTGGIGPSRGSYQLVGPPSAMAQFTVEPLTEEFRTSDLARETLRLQAVHTHAFMITEQATGRRHYFGVAQAWEVRLDETGTRLVEGHCLDEPMLYDGAGRRAPFLWIRELGGHRAAVLRSNATPLLVHFDSGRVESAIGYAWDEEAVTARYRVPGAPEGVTAEYRFDADDGFLRYEDLPLIGGGAEEAHLAPLRMRVENPPRRFPVAGLYGQGSERFRFHAPLPLRRFTLIEQASRVRFHYGRDGGLVHWDLPVAPSRYLRVPAGPEHDPHLVDSLGRLIPLEHPTQIRARVAYTPEEGGPEFRFDEAGVLTRQEWPLAGEGHLAALRSLRVVLDRSADPSVPGWTYQLVVPAGAGLVREWWHTEDAEGLAREYVPPRWAFEGTGADGSVRRYWIELPDGDFRFRALARELGSHRVLVVVDQESGERIYRAFDGRELARAVPVVPAEGAPGRGPLWLVHLPDGRRAVYDALDDLPEEERPPTRTVVDTGNGLLLGEILHLQDGVPPGAYWEIEYGEPRGAVLRDADGGVLERVERVEVSPDFTVRRLWGAGGRLILDRSRWDIVAGAEAGRAPVTGTELVARPEPGAETHVMVGMALTRVEHPAEHTEELLGFRLISLANGHTVVQAPSGLRVEYDSRGEWVRRDIPLLSSAEDGAGLTAVLLRSWDENGARVVSCRLEGGSALVARNHIEVVAPGSADYGEDFVVTDMAFGHRRFFDTAGDMVIEDRWMGDPGQTTGLGYLRFIGNRRGEALPDLVDAQGRPLETLQVEALDHDMLALVPTAHSDAPGERLVIGADRQLVGEIIAVRDEAGAFAGTYWRVDRVTGITDDLDAYYNTRDSWANTVSRFTDGWVSVYSSSGMILFSRPALGTEAGARPEGVWFQGSAPGWLTRQGTGMRLPFGREGAFEMGRLLGHDLESVSIRPTADGFAVVGRRNPHGQRAVMQPVAMRGEFTRDVDGLTVRVPTSDRPIARTIEYRFDANGTLIRQMWPLPDTGFWEPLGSLQVTLHRDPSPGFGGEPRWTHELIGPSEATGRFVIEPPTLEFWDSDLARDSFGNNRAYAFAIFEPATRIRRYYIAITAGLISKVRDVERAGLRILGAVHGPVRVYDLYGRRLPAWHAEFVDGGRAVVARDFRIANPFQESGDAPLSPPPDVLLMHLGSTPRVEFPLAVTRPEQHVLTAMFRVPGAPREARAEYRFRHGRIIRDDLPLTGGGGADEHLGSLRMVREWQIVMLEDGREVRLAMPPALSGDDAQAFQLVPQGIVGSAARGGFTVVERATGIRRRYGADRVLTYRELPVQIQAGGNGYLRVNVGRRASALQLLGADGAALPGWVAEPFANGQVLLRPTLWDHLSEQALGGQGAPLTRIVFDPQTGRPVEETLGIHEGNTLLPESYWWIDYASGRAVQRNLAGDLIQEAVVDASQGTAGLIRDRVMIFSRSEWWMPTQADLEQASPAAAAGAQVMVGMALTPVEHPAELLAAPPQEPADLLARLHYLADGRPVARELTLENGLGTLRMDMLEPSVTPQRLAAEGVPSALFRAERVGPHEVALVPVNATDRPWERLVAGSSVMRNDAPPPIAETHLVNPEEELNATGHVVEGFATADGGAWISRDIPLTAATKSLAGLSVSVTRSWARDGAEVGRYELRGGSELVARFDIAAAAAAGSAQGGQGFVITDLATGYRYHFDAEDTHVMTDVWVGDEGQTTGLGYLRFDSRQRGGLPPSLVDVHGDPLEGWQVTMADGDRLMLRPTGGSAEPFESLTVHLNGQVLEVVLGIRDVRGEFQGTYLVYDYRQGCAMTLGESGLPIAVQRASHQSNGSSILLLTDDGHVIFRRPVLGLDLEHWTDVLWGAAPQWLMGQGTARHLPFDTPGAYGIWIARQYGSPQWVRVSAATRGLELTDQQGHSLGIRAEFVRDAEGLTVRVPMPYVSQDARTVARFDTRGTLVRCEWPLVWGGGADLDPPRLIMDRSANPSALHFAYQLIPSDAADRSRIEPLTGEFWESDLARDRLGRPRTDAFAVIEEATGNRRYFSSRWPGRVLAWEMRLEPETGVLLRLAGNSAVSSQVYDLGGQRELSWHVGQFAPRRLAVLRSGGTLLCVHTDSLRVEVPTSFSWDAEVATATFPMPGAPDGARAQYRFDANARLLSMDLPLVGGAAEAYLGALRVVVTKVPRESVVLYGEAVERFGLQTPQTDAGLMREFGSGYSITELPTGLRRLYTSEGHLIYRDIPLGEGLLSETSFLRVAAGGREGEPRVVTDRGAPVSPRQPMEVARDAEGLTVRVPAPYAPQGTWAEFRFDTEGMPVRQVWPLAENPDMAGLDSLRLVMDLAVDRVPAQDTPLSVPCWAYQLDGPEEAMRRFRVEPLAEELQESHLGVSVPGTGGRLFTIINHDTGYRTYHRLTGRSLCQELPVNGEPRLRLLRRPGGLDEAATIYNESGNWLFSAQLGGSRLAVVRGDGVPLLVDVVNGRGELPVEYTRDEEGTTARFAVPGAPEGVTAEYRFDTDGWLTRVELPLTGGDAGEAHLGALRVTMEEVDTYAPILELHGEESELFGIEGPQEAAGLTAEFGHEFTVTELAAGVRRLYTFDGALVYRDLPLDDGLFLRVAAGDRDFVPQVVGADGTSCCVPMEVARDAEGLTVRLPAPYAPQGTWAEFRFDAQGMPVRQVWPLRDDIELPHLGALQVVMDRSADPSVPYWSYELIGPSDVLERLPIEVPTEAFLWTDLAMDLGNARVFMMVDHETGERVFYGFNGGRLAEELLVDGGPGFRFVRYAEGSSSRVSAGIYDEIDNRVPTVDAGADRLIVLGEADPLLVYTDTGRFEVPIRFSQDAEGGTTLWYRVLGAPDAARVEFRFAADKRLVSERQLRPLTGGGAAEAHLADVRVVREILYSEHGLPDIQLVELSGRNSPLFEMGEVTGADIRHEPDLLGGFTLSERAPDQRFTEPAAGVRRFYDIDYCLVFRDVPVDLDGLGGYLRVDMRGGQDALQLIGAGGGPLEGWRAQRLEGDRVALVPTAWDDLPKEERPPSRIVVDAGNGLPLGEILHLRDSVPPGAYWEIDYISRDAVLRDATGDALERAERVAVSRDFCIRLLVCDGEVIFDRSTWDIVAGGPVQARGVSEVSLSGGEPAGMRLRALEPGTGVRMMRAQHAPAAVTHVIDPAELSATERIEVIEDARTGEAADDSQLEDARQAVQGFSRRPAVGEIGEAEDAHAIGEFTVVPVDGGGHVALHNPSGLRTVFDAQDRWISREVRFTDAEHILDGLTAVVTSSRAEGGTGIRSHWLSYPPAGDLLGRVVRFDIAAVTEGTSQAGYSLVVTDVATGYRYHFDAAGTQVMHELWVGDEDRTTGLGYLRYDSRQPEGTLPTLVDVDGRPLEGWRVVRTPDFPGEVMLKPPGSSALPSEFLQVDASTGQLTREYIAVYDGAQELQGFQMFQHLNGELSRFDSSHRLLENGNGNAQYEADGQVLRMVRDGQVLSARQALGSAPSAGGAPHWLEGQGTARRLPFNRVGDAFTIQERFRLWVALAGGGERHAKVAASDNGLDLTVLSSDFLLDVHLFLTDAHEQAVDVPVWFARDEDGLTVRVPVPYAPDEAGAAFRFDWEGELVGAQWPLAGEWPLVGHGDANLGSLRVVMARSAEPSAAQWSYTLVGPPQAVDRFQIGLVTEEFLHSEVGAWLFAPFTPVSDLFVITEHATGILRYYYWRLPVTPAAWEEPLGGIPGVRLVFWRDTYTSTLVAQLYDARGAELPAEQLEGGWLAAIGPNGTPLLVHADSRGVEMPTEFARDAEGVTARFAAPDAPDDATVEYRFNIHGQLVRDTTRIEPVTGIRSFYGSDGRLAWREVPLEEHYCLRLPAGDPGSAPQQIHPDESLCRTCVPGEFAWDAQGLTVRTWRPYRPETAEAELRFDLEGRLLRHEWPLAWHHDRAGIGALRVAMTRRAAPTAYRPQPAQGMRPSAPRWAYELVGPQEVVRCLRIEPLGDESYPSDLAQDLFRQAPGRVLAITDRETGDRSYYRINGRLLARELPLDDELGLRLVRLEANAADLGFYDKNGDRMVTAELRGGRVVVLRELDVPLLVHRVHPDEIHPDGLRSEVPTRFSYDTQGWTARFAVPGAPEGAIAEYRFTSDGWVASEDLPLTGGGDGDALLREVRVLATHTRAPDDARLVTRALRGREAELFRLDVLPAADTGLLSDLPGGFTVTEWRTGIRRHYNHNGVLLYRDLPLSLPLQAETYVRIGVGGREGDARLISTDGVPLASWRAERLEDDRVALVPTAWDDLPQDSRPVIRMEIDTNNGRPVEETLTLHAEGGAVIGYWRIDYGSLKAVRLDAEGREVGGAAIREVRVALSPDLNTRLLVHKGMVVFDRARWRPPLDISGARVLRASAQYRLLGDAQQAVVEFSHLATEGAPQADRTIGGFAVTALDGGHHGALHIESGQRTVFDAQCQWISYEIPVQSGLTTVVTRTWAESGAELRSYELTGTSAVTARYNIAAVEEGQAQSGAAFVITDIAAGHRHYYSGEGIEVLRDVWVGDQGHAMGLGYLRSATDRPDGTLPRLVNALGDPLAGWREASVGEGHLLLWPPADSAQPLEQLRVRAADGALVEEAFAILDENRQWGSTYVRYDHERSRAMTVTTTQLFHEEEEQPWEPVRRQRDGAFYVLIREADGQVMFSRPALGGRWELRPILPQQLRAPSWMMRAGTQWRLPIEARDRFPLRVPRSKESAWRARVCLDGGLRLMAAGQPTQEAVVGAEFTRDTDALVARVPALYATEDTWAEFRLDWTAVVDARLAREIPGGFTLTERETGIRRHYTANGDLTHQDLPLEPLNPEGSYLRVEVGADNEEDDLQVFGADGALLPQWRVERLHGDRVALVPTAWNSLPEEGRPLTWMVIDSGTGQVIIDGAREDIVAGAQAERALVRRADQAMRAAPMVATHLIDPQEPVATGYLEVFENTRGHGEEEVFEDARDYFEIPLAHAADGWEGLEGLRAVVTPTGSCRLAGDRERVEQFAVAAVAEGTSDSGHAFVVTDRTAGHRYSYSAEGSQVTRDIWVGDEGQTTGLGYLRYDAGQPPGTLPRLVDVDGNLLVKLRVARLDSWRLALVPTEAGGGAPLEQLVVDARDGRLLEEIIAERSRDTTSWLGRITRGGAFGTRYWRVDRVNRIVEEFDAPDRVQEVWYCPPFRSKDGYVTVLNPATGGMTDLFNRPALGAELIEDGDYDLETLPPWLTGRGTAPRSTPRRAGDLWESLPAERAEHATPADGMADGMAVWFRLSDQPGAAMAVYRFDDHADLVGQEWPVPASDAWAPPPSLRVIAWRPSARDTAPLPAFSHRLAGPREVVERFEIGRVPTHLRQNDDLRRLFFMNLRMDEVFTITERATGIRTYYSDSSYGRGLPLWELPLGRTGMHILGRPGGDAVVINEAGKQLLGWIAEDLGGCRLVVLRDFRFPNESGIVPDVPLLLHTSSLRLELATEHTYDMWGVRARFATPGAPHGVTAEYQFDEQGWLLREDLPLTGGGSAEERLDKLRIVAERTWEETWEAGRGLVPQSRTIRRELQGTDARLFRVEELAEAEAERAPELRGGFTVTEPATGIRRHYGAGAALVFRDLPLDSPSERRGYLRVGTGRRADEPRVVGTDGAQLTDVWVMRLRDDQVAVVLATGPGLNVILLNPETGRRVEDRTHALGGVLPMLFRKVDESSGRGVWSGGASGGEPDRV
ncbi:MAG: hypothetical protein JO362_02700 [Streptomycetaceae bacterium]|nr:hypothetical protein [Streptomycetaceae bacterium]